MALKKVYHKNSLIRCHISRAISMVLSLNVTIFFKRSEVKEPVSGVPDGKRYTRSLQHGATQF